MTSPDNTRDSPDLLKAAKTMLLQPGIKRIAPYAYDKLKKAVIKEAGRKEWWRGDL